MNIFFFQYNKRVKKTMPNLVLILIEKKIRWEKLNYKKEVQEYCTYTSD